MGVCAKKSLLKTGLKNRAKDQINYKKSQRKQQNHLPQILIGASNSNNIGWLSKISLVFRHNPRISVADSGTIFPGRDPRTETI